MALVLGFALYIFVLYSIYSFLDCDDKARYNDWKLRHEQRRKEADKRLSGG